MLLSAIVSLCHSCICVIFTLLCFPKVIVCGQPQYRVSVRTNILITIPSDVVEDSVRVTLCFRERTNTDSDLSDCPLGSITRQPNPGCGQFEPLPLGNGSDAIPPAYPVQELQNNGVLYFGVGVYIVITGRRNGETETQQLVDRFFGASLGSAPETVSRLEPVTLTGTITGDFIITRLRVRVDCVPEFTGPECITPVQTTGEPPTTAATTTPQATTEQTTTTSEATTTTEEPATTTEEPTTATEEPTTTTEEPTTTTEEPTTTTEEPTTTTEEPNYNHRGTNYNHRGANYNHRGANHNHRGANYNHRGANYNHRRANYNH